MADASTLEYALVFLNRDFMRYRLRREFQEEAGWLSGLVVSTEKLRVERVVCEFRREAGLWCSHEVPASTEQLADVTIDVLDPSWEVFDGSGLASATLSIWAYCLSEGGVRAVSWSEDLREFVEIPELRRGMRIESRFRVGGAHSELSCSDRRIVVHAIVLVEAMVLETMVLEVVTGVALSPVGAVAATEVLAASGARPLPAGLNASRGLRLVKRALRQVFHAFTSRSKGRGLEPLPPGGGGASCG